MKRLSLTLVFIVSVLSVSAQYVTYPTELSTRGSTVYTGYEKLNRQEAAAMFSDMGGVDRSAEYLKYRSAYKAGLGLTIGGAAATAVGSVTFLTGIVAAVIAGIPAGMSGKDMPCGIVATYVTGGTLACVGLASMIAGIPTLCVYKSRIKGMVSDYNDMNQSRTQLTFGGQSNGLGFALNF